MLGKFTFLCRDVVKLCLCLLSCFLELDKHSNHLGVKIRVSAQKIIIHFTDFSPFKYLSLLRAAFWQILFKVRKEDGVCSQATLYNPSLL